MRLLIVELDYHPEVVQGICAALENSDIEISLLTKESIYQKVELNKPIGEVFFYETKKSDLTNLTYVQQENWDLVLFTTAQTNFKRSTKLSFNAPVAVIVHNVHAYFKRFFIKPSLQPFFIWKDLSFLIRIVLLQLDFIYRKKFIESVDVFLFPSQFMLNYAIKILPSFVDRFYKKPFHWIEAKEMNKREKDFFGITVIGAIDKRRKDYDQVIELASFLRKETTQKVKITLAGSPSGSYGKRVVARLKTFESNNLLIQTFDHFVPEHIMEEIAGETDCLFAPIVHKTRHHIWTEFYGQTKISGNINSAIKYNLPILIPSFYQTDSTSGENIITYNDKSNLFQIIINKINRTSSFSSQSSHINKELKLEMLIKNLVKDLNRNSVLNR